METESSGRFFEEIVTFDVENKRSTYSLRYLNSFQFFRNMFVVMLGEYLGIDCQ
jgi:hypothetical protein